MTTIVAHKSSDLMLVVIAGEDSIAAFQKLIFRGIDCFPQSSHEMKELADKIMYGAPQQSYYTEGQGGQIDKKYLEAGKITKE